MKRNSLGLGRTTSFLFVGFTYVLACGVAWALLGGTGGSPYWTVGLALLAAMGVTYAASLGVGNGSVFDPYWSVLPPVVAFEFAVRGAGLQDPRALALLLVILLWAVRLTVNWVRSWPDLSHEDWRYEKLYDEWPTPPWLTMLIAVQLVPTLIIWVGCLPLWPALAAGGRAFGALDVLALIVGLTATTLELVADEQMRRFARTKQTGDVMDQGLWRWSRHPNYLGEILLWVSLWLFALAANPAAWWTVVGPLTMLLMFVFVSIPMLDERSAERRPAFAEYARRTSALLPIPRRR